MSDACCPGSAVQNEKHKVITWLYNVGNIWKSALSRCEDKIFTNVYEIKPCLLKYQWHAKCSVLFYTRQFGSLTSNTPSSLPRVPLTPACLSRNRHGKSIRETHFFSQLTSLFGFKHGYGLKLKIIHKGLKKLKIEITKNTPTGPITNQIYTWGYDALLCRLWHFKKEMTSAMT